MTTAPDSRPPAGSAAHPSATARTPLSAHPSARLLALDIDGTVVDAAERVRAPVFDAVRRARQAGVHVVMSTGRSVFGITGILDLLELRQGHCVASNGAVTFTYHPVEITSATTFDAGPAVRIVLEAVPDVLVAVEVVGRGYRTNARFPDGEIQGELWIEDIDDLVAEPVTRVIIRDPSSSAEDFLQLAEQLGLHGINYFVGYTAWLDLAPAGVSKASALSKVAADLGVAVEDVLAIGDGRNDVEMLRWAGHGVAMGQAPDEVKAAADAVTGSWEEDGVAQALSGWL